MQPPIVVTFCLDDEAQRYFDSLRRREFPPERNVLAAHLTAFHAVPAAQLGVLREQAADVPDGPLSMTVTGPRMLGRGVAFDLHGSEVSDVRSRFAAALTGLTRQDSQPWRPHVTVQNRVTPERAKALRRQLEESFTPFTLRIEGMALWRYLGGPWEPLDQVSWRA